MRQCSIPKDQCLLGIHFASTCVEAVFSKCTVHSTTSSGLFPHVDSVGGYILVLLTPPAQLILNLHCFSVGCDHDQITSLVSKEATPQWKSSTLPSAVTIPVSSAVTSVTVHPHTDEIVAGTEQGMLLLLATSQ